jgi:hypothetical protein
VTTTHPLDLLSEDAPVAFVAMRFEADPWKEERDQTIRDVLTEAGDRGVKPSRVQ